MRILGVTSDGSAFLLEDAPDLVRIFDRVSATLSRAVSPESPSAAGPWEPFHGDAEKILQLVEQSASKSSES
jgi:hypothetical protein